MQPSRHISFCLHHTPRAVLSDMVLHLSHDAHCRKIPKLIYLMAARVDWPASWPLPGGRPLTAFWTHWPSCSSMSGTRLPQGPVLTTVYLLHVCAEELPHLPQVLYRDSLWPLCFKTPLSFPHLPPQSPWYLWLHSTKTLQFAYLLSLTVFFN
jgi:hypothetical protein